MEIPVSRNSAPRKALFVTFYSFKGGVGRSMALLNTAAILARLGRRVLMVDFDLEAPGLTLFQDRQRGEGAARKQPGLVDALADFLGDPETAPLADADPDRFLDTYVTTLDIPEGGRGTIEGGRLDLLPTGRLDDDYESRMHGLSFEDLFEGGVGVPMFEHLKALIRDSDRYDYVLIDSRTGFSDEGSICTRYLADALIVVTGLNRQNLHGTARFLTQAGIGTVGPKRIAFVASPVPVFYEELVAERRREAEEVLEDAGLSEARFVAEIPYHPLLALDESPWDRDLSQTLLYDAYEEIEDTLRTWAGDEPLTRMNRALELIRQGDEAEALSLIHEVRREDPDFLLVTFSMTASLFRESKPTAIRPVLEEWLSVARTSGDQSDVMRALGELGNACYLQKDLGTSSSYSYEGLLIAREVGDSKAEMFFLGSIANSAWGMGQIGKAATCYKDAIKVAKNSGNKKREAFYLRALGSWMAVTGEVGKVNDYYNEALSIAREVGDRSVEAAVLDSLGKQMAEVREAEKAIRYYEEALPISREIGEQRREVFVLGDLGVALAMLGHGAESREALTRASHIADELDHLMLRADLRVDKIEALALLNPDQALTFADDMWDTVMADASALECARAQVLRARLRAAHGDTAGAAEDAQAALDLYRPQGVGSHWSREAEAILKEVQATTR